MSGFITKRPSLQLVPGTTKGKSEETGHRAILRLRSGQISAAAAGLKVGEKVA